LHYRSQDTHNYQNAITAAHEISAAKELISVAKKVNNKLRETFNFIVNMSSLEVD